MKKSGIYILTSPSGKSYVGRDCSLPKRVKEHLSGKSPQCPAIHAAIKKYGREVFTVEMIAYPGISHEALCAVEAWHIARHDSYNNGYNESNGGAGMDSETASRLQRKRVNDGTHHFIGGEIQREVTRKRIAAGTHHFLDSERARERERKRIAAGKHHFVGDTNPAKRLSEKGRWMWVRSLAMCWYEMHNYVMKRRAEFYSQVIPDMSDAEQLELF